MRFLTMLACCALLCAPAIAQQTPATPATAPQNLEAAKLFSIQTGTHVPLSLINSVSTKNSAPGDRVYLETVFPILADGRIVIPPGSYVMGTITDIKRPGKVKGRGEFHLRFDSLTLPNGATRDFRAQVSNLDGGSSQELDRKEGTVRSEGNKAGDARTVATTAATGASLGALAGISRGMTGTGMGIGAAAGAAAGLAVILLTRGPEAILTKGTTVEMVLDRQIQFDEEELSATSNVNRRFSEQGPGPLPNRRNRLPGAGRVPEF